ncbi:MAG: carboxylating nicotinate-nucleotide diphosphorylase [Thermodesulfovibrionia bacterium]|nr:carboxylating nicotinate-nucleotide diphosphorylase [Thermodesulfovibrionia bacterium]
MASSIKKSSAYIDAAIRNALNEDIGSGDVTTSSVIPKGHKTKAVFVAKQDCIISGLPFAKRTFELLDPGVKFSVIRKEGSRLKKGTAFASVSGDTSSILMAERVALNLLQRMSGIATLTGKYVNAVKRHKARIVDTRKTAPGLRLFDKYAVKTGGGHNHRFGLFDAVLIKDNHIDAAGGVCRAVELAKRNAGKSLIIEVETRNITEVRAALSAGADIIMLDNMPLHNIKKAVDIIRSIMPKTIIEASGGINLDNVNSVAAAGVDLISVGAITHSAQASDISMKVLPR